MHKLLVCIIFILCVKEVKSQDYPQDYFRSPLDIPLLLSGTFGELRPNHFHAGIDLKTQGKSGLKVYAIADGYISRIKVSTSGYGKALYVKHDNGFSSVYAHLMRYTGKIQDYVIEQQYASEKYEIELFPKVDSFRVKKGDIIGLSGNTGGSFAPHLHFEIRNSRNQNPINALHFGLKVRDDISPIIKSLKVYSQSQNTQIDGQSSDKLIKVIGGSGGEYTLKDTVKVSGPYALGIHTYDLLNGANNKNGVYSIEIFVDNLLFYSLSMEEFSFKESRYINSHLDYSEKAESNTKLHKCLIQPNNKLSIYDFLSNDGTITPHDSVQFVEIFIDDLHGNSSLLSFHVDKVPYDESIPKDSISYVKKFPFNKRNFFKNEHITVDIPANSLYDNLYFDYKMTSDSLLFSPIHHIHNSKTAVHYSYSINIKTDVPGSLRSKAFICKLDDEDKLSYIGGKYENGYISTKTKTFGNYSVAVDTIAPIVRGLNIYPGKTMKSSTLKMTTYDDFSGIKSYNAYIDGQWVLMEFEPKSNKLTHFFKSDLKAGKHQFKLIVTDKVDNSTTYEAEFYR